MVEHRAEIERWRNGLDEVARRRCNHSNAVVAHWRRRSSPQRSGPKAKPKEPAASLPEPATTSSDGLPIATGRPIHHGQEAIRRAARAIKEHWRNPDTMTVARRVLEAAYPTDRQMLEA
jgi:hypothetical protein